MNRVLNGLDVLKDVYLEKLKGCRLGLLSNQASVDIQLCSCKEVIAQLLPGHLTAIFGPQHGHGGEDQDNMVETAHGFDDDVKAPIFSLYSQMREPTRNMLNLIDTLIIDLQDVGTRVYTFASTLLNCLRATARLGKKVVVLDRPNPLGGDVVEGNLLDPELYSFVGPYSLPMRHGLTMAEMARIFDRVFRIGSDMEIIPMQGWTRKMLWEDTGLRWIMPSPNMPLPETAHVYPGQIIWEGTNLSEGRGTCRPFEMFGSPFLNTKHLLDDLAPEAKVGCYLQKISFRPTFNKWADEICHGLMIHVLNPRVYRPYFTSIALLKTIIELHGEHFTWKQPPYEYEFEKMPIDLILGNRAVRMGIEAGGDLLDLERKWGADLDNFLEWRKPYLLYA